MKIIKLVFLFSGALLLSSCDTKILLELNLSDLLQPESKALPGRVLGEVAACSSHEDSRIPSGSLSKVREVIPSIFPDAEFKECFSRGFTSYAEFGVPIYLDREANGELESDSHINVTSNENLLIGVSVPDNIKQNLERAQSSNSLTGKLDIDVGIKITNDIARDFQMNVISSFVDDEAIVLSDVTLPAGSSFVLTLSEVSVSEAFNFGVTPILRHVED